MTEYNFFGIPPSSKI